ncbi:TetR/AcrR family transcriptional regulator [Frigidibacter oleivorans]|uniref:TetR/AcrR family transcriptional regulator n=1 Tax=Frigidibacter oleivorans TaxID=2487129 RepID=UPI000F8CF5FD|nr:TetR/AcrR family transcriptional regulator [Frigidibacter oleivorans]
MGGEDANRELGKGAYHHGNLRAALLDAAGDLLESSGADAISFRALSRHVGVSQTAPYNHFDSREGLLAALAEQGYERLRLRQDAITDPAAADWETLHALGRDYVAFALEKPQLYRLMFGAFITSWADHPGAALAKRRTIEPLMTALSVCLSGRSDSDRRDAAISLWCLVHGYAMLRIDGSRFLGEEVTPDDPVLERILSSALAGLALDAGWNVPG